MMQKNTKLLRAMSEIDDKYVVEILDEDKNRSSATVRKKKKGTVVRYIPYAIPAAAAVLIIFAVSRMGNLSSGTMMSESNAPAAASDSAAVNYEAATDDYSAPMNSYHNEKDSDAASMDNAAGVSAYESETLTMEEAETASVQIANPFIDCDDPDEAAGVAGFELRVPDDLIPGAGRMINAVENEMIQVIYFDGEEYDPEKEILRIRKAPGNIDVSGDTTSYAYEKTEVIEGLKVLVRGDSADRISVATWEYDGFSYAVLMGNEQTDLGSLSNIITEITE